MHKLKNSLQLFSLVLFIPLLLMSCENMNSNMEEQLNSINKRAEELDSAVNKGLDQVENLDSTITAKSKTIRNLDSMVRKTTTRIDSVINTSEINRHLN